MQKLFVSRRLRKVSLRIPSVDVSKLQPYLKKLQPLAKKIRPLAPFILIALASFIIGFSLKRFVPIAIINGRTIDRVKFNDLLIRRAGRVALQELIINDLVQTEAKKRDVEVTDKEVEAQVNIVKRDLKERGFTLDQYLAQQALSENEFEEQVEIQLLVKKMFGGGIKVTEREMDQFYKINNVVKGKGAILRSQRIAITQAITQAELRQTYSKWLSQELKKAKITHLIDL